jgi:hypothetical protein
MAKLSLTIPRRVPERPGAMVARRPSSHHNVKWNVFVTQRQIHQASVVLPPSILANPRWPGCRSKAALSTGITTS